MKLRHFEELAPVCPQCRTRGETSSLTLSRREVVEDSTIIEGILTCTAPECQCEFPIIDGVPILLADVRTYIANNHQSLARRRDLSPSLDSLLAECAGPGSWDEATRQHLSGAVWDHFAEFDPAEHPSMGKPGAIARVIAAAADRSAFTTPGPALDIGCGVARSSLEIAAKTNQLTLGIELHSAMARVAQHLLRTGRIDYQRRISGILYERREFAVPLPEAAELVDVWIMDALNPCVRAATFGSVSCMNVIDCTTSPLALLTNIAHLLKPGAHAAIATPFDWSANVTAIESWLGGHSPRGYFNGRSEDILAAILTPNAHPASIEGLALKSDSRDIPWHVRLHERALMQYMLQMVVVRKA